MQSPINVKVPAPEPQGSTGSFFFVDYKFEENIPVIIKPNGAEIVISFQWFPGAFKIIYDHRGNMVSYRPRNMSFRFPAEHLINGFRNDGEILLVCDEITPRENNVNFLINIQPYAITNGLEFVIPIQFHLKAPEYKELDALNPEIWRRELAKNRSYTPKDSISGKIATFNLHSFMKNIMNLHSDFSMYLGSSTTPPCNGNIFNNNKIM